MYLNDVLINIVPKYLRPFDFMNYKYCNNILYKSIDYYKFNDPVFIDKIEKYILSNLEKQNIYGLNILKKIHPEISDIIIETKFLKYLVKINKKRSFAWVINELRNIDIFYNDGYLINFACEKGRKRILKTIIEKNNHGGLKYVNRKTLICSLKSGDARIIKYLNKITKKTKSILDFIDREMMLHYFHNLEIIDFLIKERPQLIYYIDNEFLSLASFYCSIEHVDFIIKNIQNISLYDHEEEILLHAIRNEEMDFLKYILDKGFIINSDIANKEFIYILHTNRGNINFENMIKKRIKYLDFLKNNSNIDINIHIKYAFLYCIRCGKEKNYLTRWLFENCNNMDMDIITKIYIWAKVYNNVEVLDMGK